MISKGITAAVLSLLATASNVHAHTWVESVYQIDATGAFSGKPGFPIGYLPRSQGVSDDQHQTKILDTSTNPSVCKPLSSSDAKQYPPLQAAAGDYLALLYQENGHVTQPELTPRPYRGGNVYVYGTMNHQDTDGINDVLNSWTADGKGGNQKGRMLASHYFDDDQCFQDAPGNPIVAERKAKFGVNQLSCQTDVQLPDDLPSEGTYTLIWVWDWPQILSDTKNVTEIYTSCAQIDLKGGRSVNGEALGAGRPKIKFGQHNKIESAAISSQVHSLIEATALGVGTNSPPAPTGAGKTTATSQSGPEPTVTASSSAVGSGSNDGGIKTVTVTAEPETIIQYHTVTMGAGESGDSDATSKLSTTAAATSTIITASDTPSATASDTPSTTASDTPSTTASDTPSTTVSDTPSTTASDTPSTTASDTPSITASDTPSITPTPTETVITYPTSIVPVTSVQGFLKARAPRVTGHARRNAMGHFW